jgi:sec-independent protein translocase protein TatA
MLDSALIIPTVGWQELLIILVILALLFGASRVAGLGGALGKGIREFRKEAKGDEVAGSAAEPEPEATRTETRTEEPAARKDG